MNTKREQGHPLSRRSDRPSPSGRSGRSCPGQRRRQVRLGELGLGVGDRGGLHGRAPAAAACSAGRVADPSGGAASAPCPPVASGEGGEFGQDLTAGVGPDGLDQPAAGPAAPLPQGRMAQVQLTGDAGAAAILLTDVGSYTRTSSAASSVLIARTSSAQAMTSSRSAAAVSPSLPIRGSV